MTLYQAAHCASLPFLWSVATDPGRINALDEPMRFRNFVPTAGHATGTRQTARNRMASRFAVITEGQPRLRCDGMRK
jgi:hypothetical protein